MKDINLIADPSEKIGSLFVFSYSSCKIIFWSRTRDKK